MYILYVLEFLLWCQTKVHFFHNKLRRKKSLFTMTDSGDLALALTLVDNDERPIDSYMKMKEEDMKVIFFAVRSSMVMGRFELEAWNFF
jgi:hypothetical protein